MQSGNLKSYLNLHLIVFIWGFTAVLGDLISIGEAPLVWYRMGLAIVFLLLFAGVARVNLSLPPKAIGKLVLVGFLIALHWLFFFKAIKVSNVSVTLAMFSMGAFFAAILEPIFYKRKMLWYEVFFGLIIIAGLFTIMQVEIHFLAGILYALLSVFLGVMFTIFNGKLIQEYNPTAIAVYEFAAGFAMISIYLAYEDLFQASFFRLSAKDWTYLVLLASVCTAYAFTASVHVMRRLTPYTVMLTTNLEPVYGIILAYFIIGDDEKMSLPFYIGSGVILATVIANGVIKHYFEKVVSG
ncbi:EamA domain-containing protein [Flavobacterium longum]|uniref:DMT family transporter n=1 Tax=Flavobacterium longum TaxID=1299340 RepID=UPI0039ED1DFD